MAAEPVRHGQSHHAAHADVHEEHEEHNGGNEGEFSPQQPRRQLFPHGSGQRKHF